MREKGKKKEEKRKRFCQILCHMIHDVISSSQLMLHWSTAFVAPELLGTKKGETKWAKGKNTCAKVPFPEEEPD